MRKAFEMDTFLDAVAENNQHACINDAYYEWNGNNWVFISDRHGEAFALKWIKDNAPQALSKSAAQNAWGTLKLDLLIHNVSPVRTNEVVIPCQGTYVVIDEKGDVSLEAPGKERYCTHSLTCNYDPTAEAPLFETFLDQALPDPELRSRVQEYVGYTLLPDNRYQRAAMWLGCGANGKGVLSNIIQALHKDVAAIQLNNHSRFGLSGLYKATLIVADEIPKGTLDEARLKSIIGKRPTPPSFDLARALQDWSPLHIRGMSNGWQSSNACGTVARARVSVA